MKKYLSLVSVLCLTIFFGGAACSRSHSEHPAGTIQQDFYRLPEKGGSPTFNTEPDSTTVAAVKNVFRIQSQAIEQVMPVPALGQLSDWVRWHLQGIIVSFGLSVDGVFGALFSSGATTIKGTWVPKSPAIRKTEKSSVKTDLALSSLTRTTDIHKQLDPALRAAVRSGAIKNESAFRKNAFAQAERFHELCQAFSTARFADGWKVDQYRLELGFSADGKIAGTGAGVAVHLRFDWNAPTDQESFAASSVVESGSVKSFRNLVGVLSEEIRSAVEDAGDLESSGFALDEVRIGIGVSADGEIGIAHASVDSMGSVTFSRDESASAPAATRRLVSLPASVALIGSRQDGMTAQYAAQLGVDQQNGVYQVKRGSFRKGLVRAMKIGGWMTRMAAEAPSTQWELSEIEAEFDLSVSGTVGVTVVDGVGAVILGFARKEGR